MNKLLKNKYYLYLTEFFAGMAVMAVELGASRLLAPYFSSSQIVWTIIIGTIMIAMALGNVYGGRSADKNPNPDRLYMRIIIAAIWIALIPVVGKYIILLITGLLVVTVNTNLLIWAAFIACMVIFVFPLFLLGTVTPSLAKYTMSSLDDNGKTVGALGACNTIGSIIGTFLPTFVTIPKVGTAVTFLIFSGVLLVLGLIYFAAEKKKLIPCIIAVVIFVLASIFGNINGFAFWDDNKTYEGESVYNYILIKEDEESIRLSTNVLFGVQSVKMKQKGISGKYFEYDMAAPFMAGLSEDNAANILVLGNCAGNYATICREYFPHSDVEGVEIDEKITQLAEKYFDMPKEVSVTTYDGRAYLNVIDKKYDVIMVDAYQDITIPFQMSSVEFFTLVKEHLNKNGVMVVNLNMHNEEEGSINSYLCDTIANVFDNVYTIDVEGWSGRELFASENGDMLKCLEEGISGIENAGLKSLMEYVSEGLVSYEKGGYILTDDNAPVELLGMKVIDSIIKDELVYYKKVFKEEGFKGLLNSY
ncbi:MAG: fused MFS/spermidine synthase [Lachnospiraceae bacterium]|nr:fused MFS/spermidine synthase [Lachnospiraceae bacterium]